MGQFREIEDGGVAFDAEGSDVVCSGCHFRVRECTEPNSRFLAWLATFGHPFTPTALADPAIHRVLVGVSNAL